MNFQTLSNLQLRPLLKYSFHSVHTGLRDTSDKKYPSCLWVFLELFWCQRSDVLASEKGLQLMKVITPPAIIHMSWHGAVFFVPTSLYNSNKSLNTQVVTKQELPKYQADQNPTYQIDSLKTESNKKVFAEQSHSNKICKTNQSVARRHFYKHFSIISSNFWYQHFVAVSGNLRGKVSVVDDVLSSHEQEIYPTTSLNENCI